MQEKARIVEISGDIVTAIPLDIEVCIGCQNTECKTNGSVFSAINRRKFPIKIGSEVKIAASLRKQVLQAVFAIGFPVLLAVGGFHSVPFFNPWAGEGWRIAAALVLLIVGAVILFQMRMRFRPDLPEIVAILEGDLELTEAKDFLPEPAGDPGSGT